jgi:hypothetical protein
VALPKAESSLVLKCHGRREPLALAARRSRLLSAYPDDDGMAFADRWTALRPKYVIDRHEAQCAGAAGLDRPRP